MEEDIVSTIVPGETGQDRSPAHATMSGGGLCVGKEGSSPPSAGPVADEGRPPSPESENGALLMTYEELCEGLPDRSLGIFHLQNPLRKLCIYIIRSWYFDQFILGVIFMNCIFLAMQTREPGFEESARGKVVQISEYLFTSIFLAELVVKVTAMGFFTHPGSYLRDGWNILDFIVVVLGVLSFFNFGNYTGIRTVRVLRPLRTITGVEGMRVIVSTLLTSLPMLLDVLILCMFLLVIFGIVGVQFFANKLEKRCYTPVYAEGSSWPSAPVSWEIEEEQKSIVCKGPIFPSLAKPDSGRACPPGMFCQYYNNPNYNITSFDNILFAWLTIFQCISLEGWTDVMYDLQDGFGDSVVIYFIVLIVFGSFFAVNLALAVLTLHFTETANEEAEDEPDYTMLNDPPKPPPPPAAVGEVVKSGIIDRIDSQGIAHTANAFGAEYKGNVHERTEMRHQNEIEKKRHLKKVFEREMHERAHSKQANSLVRFCYEVQKTQWFEYLTMGLICLNTVIMSLDYDGIHYQMEEAFEITNYVLTGYFALEMAIKMTGLGIRGYSHDRMNVFDGVVVLCSIIEIIVSRAVGGNAASGLSVLRSFRLLRVFKLARSWKQLNKIIKTIFKSLASIAYLSLILLLVIFIFALMGMQFFGYELAFCDYVDGAQPICPPYDETCPNNRDCYIPCLQQQNGQWITAEGSRYNDQALCLSYPPPGFEFMMPPGDAHTYLAKVGKSVVSRHNFNNIYWSIVTIFQILTGENWNTVMYDAMRSKAGYIASVYFILLVVIGNYIILNLFLAILLDNFGKDSDADDDDDDDDDDRGGADKEEEKRAREERGGGNGKAGTGGSGGGENDDHRTSGVDDPHAASSQQEDSRRPVAGGHSATMIQFRDWSNVIKDMHASSHFNVVNLRKRDATGTGGHRSRGGSSGDSSGAGGAGPTPNASQGDLAGVAVRTATGSGAAPPKDIGSGGSGSPVNGDSDGRSEAQDAAMSRRTKDKGDNSPTPSSSGSSPPTKTAAGGEAKRDERSESSMVPKPVRINSHGIHGVEGYSLGIFAPNNRLRLFLTGVVNHPRFEQFIIGVIIVSSIVLAMDEPRIDEGGTLKKVLNILDIIFVYTFLLECVIKVIVLGFVVNRGSYLRNRWNILDFIIVIVGLISINASGGGGQVGALRALRTLRALRPIRMASRAQGMKVVVNALFQAIPGCGNVALVCGLFYLIFGILGVNLLKGMFFHCEGCVCEYDAITGAIGACNEDSCERLDPDMVIRGNALAVSTGLAGGKTSMMTEFWCNQRWHVVDFAHSAGYFQGDVDFVSNSLNRTQVSSLADSHAMNGQPYLLRTEWKNRDTNFDDIGHALLALFEMATLEMWLDVMYDGMDATEKHYQPLENFNPYIGIFFIFFIIVGGLFVLNLFVGVTIDKFNEMREEQDGSSVFMTKEQENWKRIQKLLMNIKPRQTTKPPRNQTLATIHSVVSRESFDVFIIVMILLNAAFLAMYHEDMSPNWELTLNVANYFFTSVFTIEATLKMLAHSVRGYFMDSWNVFDFFTVVISWIGIILDSVSGSQIPAVSVFRVFRVARVFRLIPKAKGLRTLLHTLTFSLPALVNVGSVFVLFLFIYAVMGMNLFGLIKHGEHVNDKASFDTFPKAMLLLFRMATGESWNGIMHDCMITRLCTKVISPLYPELHNQYFNADDPRIYGIGQDNLENGCSPHPVVAIVYFISFVVLCAFVMLNLVVGVILDNFQDSNTVEAMPVSREHLERFANVWGQLDPRGTYYVSASKLSHIISQVDPPLGVRGVANDKASTQAIVLCIDVPEHGGKIHFLETLHALAGRVAGTDLPEREMKKIRDTAQEKLPSLKDDFVPRYSASHYNAALYVQAAVRGFLARQELKERLHPFEIPDESTAPEESSEDTRTTTATPATDNYGGNQSQNGNDDADTCAQEKTARGSRHHVDR